MADNGPPTGGGGGGGTSSTKRRRRKRGGGGGGGGNNKDNTKDAPPPPPAAKKDSGSTTTTASTTNAPPSSSGGGGGGGGGGGRGGNKGRKRGGGGRGGGGGGGESSSSSARMNKSATSPLQLPHVKVTLRNIGNASKHGTVEGVVDSIRTFLEGTFPSSSSLEDNDTTNSAAAAVAESSAYMMAWQLEKEEFEQHKSIFAAEVMSSSNTTAASENKGSSDSSSSIRAFSSGVYKDKPSPPPSNNRQTVLPSAAPIVSELNKAAFTSINSMIDAAMSKMMQECGKQYIPYVGGRVVLEEESAVDCMLAEKIQAERLKKKEEDGESGAVEEDEKTGATSGEITAAADGGGDAKPSSVESVTKGMEKLTTSDNKINNQKSNNNNKIPAIRVRILSVTPVKKSKRRGEIGAKVQLVLYPPDPCLLFQELCRDAGKLVVKKHTMTNESMKNADESNKEMETDKKSSAEKNDNDDKKSKKPSPSTTVKAATPQIPNFPLLTSSERSRALARSRILINRTIEAMKIGARTLNTRGIDNNRPWEIFESPSQKTWKSRQNPMIGSLLAGASLQDVIAESEKAKTNAASSNKKGRERFKSREDRYDSTIENSEDYKTFMQFWQNDGAYPSNNPGDDETAKKEESVAVDEEGRPLSAIVMDIRKKKDEEAKKKADAKAAAAKAREAARSAQEALKKKEKSKKKKEKDKNRRSERRKKAKAAAARAPPTLLQKAGTGFGG